MKPQELATIEQARLKLQQRLDAAKSQAERNKLGQFATPSELAGQILDLAKSHFPKGRPIRFLDPALGTGSFFSALLRCFSGRRFEWALGYEIDADYADAARAVWKDTRLKVITADFTSAAPPTAEAEKATLIVCNPPYVRHHHLDGAAKLRLRSTSALAAGMDLNGLTGLYCYFVALGQAWMADDALAIWLIPSEFMDVNYGRPLKEYLLSKVTLLRIHRFDPAEVQFGDALVSSAIVCFRNAVPSPDHLAEFSYGGSLAKPRCTRMLARSGLHTQAKWTTLMSRPERRAAPRHEPRVSDIFAVKRGIATGSNEFFILPVAEATQRGLPAQFLKPILPGPRLLRTNVVESDAEGNPLVEPRLMLLDCKLPEQAIRDEFPQLWAYLKGGMARGMHERYLSRHRSPWYAQEEREPAPLLCTYMGRSVNGRGAFRFILNRSRAIAANVYLMLYPTLTLARILRAKPGLLEAVWAALGEIPQEALMGAGRVYGGGLHKLEPKELANAPADTLLAALPAVPSLHHHQLAITW